MRRILPSDVVIAITIGKHSTIQIRNHIHHHNSPLGHRRGGHHARRFAQVCRQKSRVHQKRPQHQSSSVILSGSEQDDTNNNNNANGNGNGGTGVLESVGLVSQPIVWISLYSVATTGHGLPAGPGGSIGAVEGIAYLVVVAMALLPTSVTAGGNDDDGGSSLARTLSRTSIAVGLLVLAGVAVGKGYVPNAKPILDYSAYLPVCSAE